MSNEDEFANFEKAGEAQVRDMAPNLVGRTRILAYKWLVLKDEESRRRSENSQAEQIRTARIAKNAAIVAAIAAVIAIPLAIIAIIFAYLSWAYPRH